MFILSIAKGFAVHLKNCIHVYHYNRCKPFYVFSDRRNSSDLRSKSLEMYNSIYLTNFELFEVFVQFNPLQYTVTLPHIKYIIYAFFYKFHLLSLFPVSKLCNRLFWIWQAPAAHLDGPAIWGHSWFWLVDISNSDYMQSQITLC